MIDGTTDGWPGPCTFKRVRSVIPVQRRPTDFWCFRDGKFRERRTLAALTYLGDWVQRLGKPSHGRARIVVCLSRDFWSLEFISSSAHSGMS